MFQLANTSMRSSFYGRDWDRKEDPAKTYRDEWMYMNNIKGDVFIEYIYLFKDNRWHVSTSEYINEKKLKNSYDGGVHYYSKFEPVIMNKEYIKYKDKHEKHAEVKMISQIGKALSGQFPADDIMMQGAAMKKKAN